MAHTACSMEREGGHGLGMDWAWIGHGHAPTDSSQKGFLWDFTKKKPASVLERIKTNWNFYESLSGKPEFGNLFVKSKFLIK